MLLTFVIPTLNEQDHIAETIGAVRRFAGFEHEIIVVDNGSTDGTVALARGLGAIVLIERGVTIAALRNIGARLAQGDVLVFIDADVKITPSWEIALPEVLARLERRPSTVTGSRCGISASGTWIERSWFAPLVTRPATYINCGHLVTTRALFEALDGFDPSLETGEDTDFARRARARGAEVVNEPRLAVVHEGYPRTLRDFVARERWHGRGNFQSWRSAFSSLVGILTQTFSLLHVGALVALIAGSATAAIVQALLVASVCWMAALTMYHRSPATVTVNAYLYYWYFVGRGLALVDAIARPLRRPRPACCQGSHTRCPLLNAGTACPSVLAGGNRRR